MMKMSILFETITFKYNTQTKTTNMSEASIRETESLCKGCMDNRLTQKIKKMQKIFQSLYGNDRTRFCDGK